MFGQGRPKATMANSKARDRKCFEKRSRLQQSFEVKGSASLKQLATSTTVKAFLYVFRLLPRPGVSCGKKGSAWELYLAWTHRNWGEECVLERRDLFAKLLA